MKNLKEKIISTILLLNVLSFIVVVILLIVGYETVALWIGTIMLIFIVGGLLYIVIGIVINAWRK